MGTKEREEGTREERKGKMGKGERFAAKLRKRGKRREKSVTAPEESTRVSLRDENEEEDNGLNERIV